MRRAVRSNNNLLARIAFTTEPILSRNTAIAFEFGLAAIALGVGWLVGFSPLRSLPFESGLQTLAHIGWGLGCVLPMLGMLCLIELSRWRPLIQLRDDVREIIRSIFGDASWFELALLAAAAGKRLSWARAGLGPRTSGGTRSDAACVAEATAAPGAPGRERQAVPYNSRISL